VTFGEFKRNRRFSWPISRYYPEIHPEGLRESQKSPVSIVGVPAEIRIWYLPRTYPLELTYWVGTSGARHLKCGVMKDFDCVVRRKKCGNYGIS
jgi:hypothetical protein